MNSTSRPEIDTALRRRRRMVEVCALVSRGIGLISTLAVAVGWVSQGSIVFSPVLLQSCWVALVVMAAANIFAALSLARPGSRYYTLFGMAQVLLDTSLITGMVVLFAIYGQRTTWPLLAVPIVIGALRGRLVGAMTVWAITSASFAGAIFAMGDRAVRPEDLPFALSIHLLVALVTGTQASAFHRQVAHLRETRAALEDQANHDGLTGLPNRARIADHFRTLHGEQLTVLLLDLDGFKPVNDTYGHAIGDQVLRVVAQRFGEVLSADDMAARLGGDEFLVLLRGADAQDAEALVGRIHEVIDRPITIGGHTVTVGTSVGLAVRPPGQDEDLESLTGRADALMYEDKARRHGLAQPAAGAPTTSLTARNAG